MNFTKVKQLTNAEEVNLIQLAQKNDLKAGEKLLCANYLFICKLAYKYAFLSGHQVDSQDLIQEGCMGFMHSIHKFHTNKIGTVKFIAYAQYYIREYMRNYIRAFLNKDMHFKYKMKVINESSFRYVKHDTLSHIIDKINTNNNHPENIMVHNERENEVQEVFKHLKADSKMVEIDIINTLLEKDEPIIAIARKYNVSRQRIDQRKKVICSKLKALAEDSMLNLNK